MKDKQNQPATIKERFEKKFHAVRDCSGKQEHLSNCQGCIDVLIEETDDFLAFIYTEISALLDRVEEESRRHKMEIQLWGSKNDAGEWYVTIRDISKIVAKLRKQI